jgi:hypothetical protein
MFEKMTLVTLEILMLEQKDIYCVGFQNGGLQSKEGKDMVLLGGLHYTTLANPLPANNVLLLSL